MLHDTKNSSPSRIQTIANLCRLAGQPERAAAFIMDRRTPSDVLAALSGKRAFISRGQADD